MSGPPELVVLSHLRWTFVWQRPQHLISRLGRGRRTWYVEEPVVSTVTTPRLCVERHGDVRRVWFEVPGRSEGWDGLDFDDPRAADYGDALSALLGPAGQRTLWLYTPLALSIAHTVGGDGLVYDVMDDLSAFAKASPRLAQARNATLEEADLVFTGGRSLDAGVRHVAPERTHLFASGVEPEHYAGARERRQPRARPVAGYVGVIDERLDLELLAGLAAELPDWDLELAGPVAEGKLDPALLPQAPNLRYLGMQPYERLPEVMGGFDVALMPFALNEATRSISPTKTLEYLAAGLPVVSTRVPDVVTDYDGVVDLRDDAAGFAAACREVLEHPVSERDEKLDALLAVHHWDAIAERMAALMGQLATQPTAA